jgi:3-hydroxyisobutyrate dehydrogenase-like beta-hydroxyacid dehydrogenase
VTVALAEALAITKEHGVEGAQLLEAFQGNANCSPLITMKLPAMMSGSYEAHFSLKNMLKDARYAQALAKEREIATPVLDASEAVMHKAEAAGRGELDYAVVYENLAGRSRAGSGKKPKIKIPNDDARNALRASAFDAEKDNPAAP